MYSKDLMLHTLWIHGLHCVCCICTYIELTKTFIHAHLNTNKNVCISHITDYKNHYMANIRSITTYAFVHLALFLLYFWCFFFILSWCFLPLYFYFFYLNIVGPPFLKKKKYKKIYYMCRSTYRFNEIYIFFLHLYLP